MNLKTTESVFERRKSMLNSNTDMKRQSFDFTIVDTKLVWFDYEQKAIWHFELENRLPGNDSS